MVRGDRVSRFAVLIFGAVGVIFGGIGAFWLVDTLRFRAGAERAEGVVTRFIDASDSESNAVKAAVEFRHGGRTFEIQSRVASSPPAYSPHETVGVLYHPGNPEGGRIDSFSEQFLFPIVFGGVGVLALVIGLAVLVGSIVRRRRERRAFAEGVPVQARVVEILRRSKDDDCVNWALVAEYHDESRDRTCRFKSPALRSDPAARYPVGSSVTVYYLPEKPTVYAFAFDDSSRPVVATR